MERQALAAMAAGAEVDVHEMLDQLDAALTELPTTSDLPLDQQVYRRSLGVA